MHQLAYFFRFLSFFMRKSVVSGKSICSMFPSDFKGRRNHFMKELDHHIGQKNGPNLTFNPCLVALVQPWVVWFGLVLCWVAAIERTQKRKNMINKIKDNNFEMCHSHVDFLLPPSGAAVLEESFPPPALLSPSSSLLIYFFFFLVEIILPHSPHALLSHSIAKNQPKRNKSNNSRYIREKLDLNPKDLNLDPIPLLNLLQGLMEFLSRNDCMSSHGKSDLWHYVFCSERILIQIISRINNLLRMRMRQRMFGSETNTIFGIVYVFSARMNTTPKEKKMILSYKPVVKSTKLQEILKGGRESPNIIPKDMSSAEDLKTLYLTTRRGYLTFLLCYHHLYTLNSFWLVKFKMKQLQFCGQPYCLPHTNNERVFAFRNFGTQKQDLWGWDHKHAVLFEQEPKVDAGSEVFCWNFFSFLLIPESLPFSYLFLLIFFLFFIFWEHLLVIETCVVASIFDSKSISVLNSFSKSFLD
ncbi:putative signal peptide protein [Puccinia sorghi]|uniref:Putative signal peptide protein n=1 Tax=Puccinia sorghi TaxID=27349 RepID=A0A0L6VC90_9BASI|nr:putative signal peptide protein [Puccinia sorghi]